MDHSASNFLYFDEHPFNFSEINYYGEYCENHYFPNVGQYFNEHCLKCWEIDGKPPYHIPKGFLEAFIKFQTSWQWHWYYALYYRNDCFPTVQQYSTFTLPEYIHGFYISQKMKKNT